MELLSAFHGRTLPVEFVFKLVVMRAAGLLLFLGIITVNLAWPESTPREALLVLSKGDHTLAIVDPSSLKVVAKAPVGEDPHEVIASSDGKFGSGSV